MKSCTQLYLIITIGPTIWPSVRATNHGIQKTLRYLIHEIFTDFNLAPAEKSLQSDAQTENRQIESVSSSV